MEPNAIVRRILQRERTPDRPSIRSEQEAIRDTDKVARRIAENCGST